MTRQWRRASPRIWNLATAHHIGRRSTSTLAADCSCGRFSDLSAFGDFFRLPLSLPLLRSPTGQSPFVLDVLAITPARVRERESQTWCDLPAKVGAPPWRYPQPRPRSTQSVPARPPDGSPL